MLLRTSLLAHSTHGPEDDGGTYTVLIVLVLVDSVTQICIQHELIFRLVDRGTRGWSLVKLGLHVSRQAVVMNVHPTGLGRNGWDDSKRRCSSLGLLGLVGAGSSQGGPLGDTAGVQRGSRDPLRAVPVVDILLRRDGRHVRLARSRGCGGETGVDLIRGRRSSNGGFAGVHRNTVGLLAASRGSSGGLEVVHREAVGLLTGSRGSSGGLEVVHRDTVGLLAGSRGSRGSGPGDDGTRRNSTRHSDPIAARGTSMSHQQGLMSQIPSCVHALEGHGDAVWPGAIRVHGDGKILRMQAVRHLCCLTKGPVGEVLFC